MPAEAIQFTMVFFGAALCALLFGCAVRVARCLKLGLYPPKWGGDYVAAGGLAQAGAGLWRGVRNWGVRVGVAACHEPPHYATPHHTTSLCTTAHPL